MNDKKIKSDYDLLDMDEKTRQFVDRREKRKTRNNYILAIGLILVLGLSVIFYSLKLLPKESFQYVWASFIGGFVGRY